MAIPDNILPLLKAEAKEHFDRGGLFLRAKGAGKVSAWFMVFVCPETHKKTKGHLGDVWVDATGKNIMGMGFADARAKRGEWATLVQAGQSPVKTAAREVAQVQAAHADAKALEADTRLRAAKGLPPKDSFRDCAMRYVDEVRSKNRKDATYVTAWERSLAKYVYPEFGDLHVAEVTAAQVKVMQDKLLVKVKADARCKSGLHALILARRITRMVFDWALKEAQSLRVRPNPVEKDEELWDDIPEAQSHAALVEGETLRDLILAIRAPVPAQSEWDLRGGKYPTQGVARALRLALLVGQRPHNIARAKKAHFHLDAPIPHWVIPAIEMKGRTTKKRKASAKAHVVFLSQQAVALVREQRAASADSVEWLFPGEANSKSGHMDRSTPGGRLIKMGFKGQHTTHGFRATLRTVGEADAGCNPIALEAMLSHKNAKDGLEMSPEVQHMLNGGMPGVYDRKAQLAAHKANIAQLCSEAMQRWADWLDEQTKPRLALVA